MFVFRIPAQLVGLFMEKGVCSLFLDDRFYRGRPANAEGSAVFLAYERAVDPGEEEEPEAIS